MQLQINFCCGAVRKVHIFRKNRALARKVVLAWRGYEDLVNSLIIDDWVSNQILANIKDAIEDLGVRIEGLETIECIIFHDEDGSII